MPAIRLASHYLRRKPFSLFFFLDAWLRATGFSQRLHGKKDNNTVQQHKNLQPGSLLTAVTLALCLQHKTLGETCCFFLASAKLCPRQPFGRFMEGFRSVYTKIGLIIVRRINSHCSFFDRQTDRQTITLIEVAPFKTRKSDPK